MSKLVVGEIEDAAGANPYSITLGTESTTTGGSSIDITSIPSGVKKITILITGLSANADSNLIVQLGDSGGVETSGYVSTTSRDSGGTAAFTNGFNFEDEGSGAGGETWQGVMELCLQDSSANTWSSWSMSGGSSQNFHQCGTKSLSATLDRVRLTTTGGSATFDVNSGINIQYQ